MDSGGQGGEVGIVKGKVAVEISSTLFSDSILANFGNSLNIPIFHSSCYLLMTIAEAASQQLIPTEITSPDGDS